MVAAWILKLPWTDIDSISRANQISSNLIGAIVMQESAGDANATRYESHYRWLLNPDKYAVKNNISLDTETIQQKTSWGLMQIMGGVARELGYEGPLVKLCKPRLNLHYGIKQLIKLRERHDLRLDDVLASYNAGSPRKLEDGKYINQEYVDGVKKYLREL